MGQWHYLLSGLVALCAAFLYLGYPFPRLPSNGPSLFFFFPGESHLGKSHVNGDIEWNQLCHLGGNSPWIPKIGGTVSTNVSAPEKCRVEQVHMLSRHAERYPTLKAGTRMLDLYYRIQTHEGRLNGSLSFASDWDFLTMDPSQHLENLVSTGPYAGTLEAFSTGVKLRTRYIDLLESALELGKVTFWASGSHRVEETARYFGAGFFGLEWQKYARLAFVPETPDLGGDTLTPGDTCHDYANDVNDHGHAYGARMLSEFQRNYIPDIASRLAQENPDMPFSRDEVYAMQEICGFETIAKGSSPWCNVFTHEEWESFEYARDLLHYYRAGPGNPYGATMGWLWLNATANLLRQGSEVGEMFFSFVHDGDIIPMLAALELFPQDPDLPATHVLQDRTWRTSDITPMGGRVIFERLACTAPVRCWNNGPFYPNHIYCEKPREDIHVRVNVNDGIVAIPGCQSGPGGSCPVREFLDKVRKRGQEVGDFRKVCGLSDEAAEGITFLHQ